MKIISVVSYCWDWPRQFQNEAEHIKAVLGANLSTIYHIGSTAVPGLCAKPIIDILAVAHDMYSVIPALESINYAYKGEINIPGRAYFSKKLPYKIHLHLYPAHHAEIELNLKFRDYLRRNQNACDKYGAIKQQNMIHRVYFPNSTSQFSEYTIRKAHLIHLILDQAGFNRIRLLYCTHPHEKQSLEKMRSHYFHHHLKSSDCNNWTLDHPDHCHIVIYQGTRIIGFIHLKIIYNSFIYQFLFVVNQQKVSHEVSDEIMKIYNRWLQMKLLKHIGSTANSE